MREKPAPGARLQEIDSDKTIKKYGHYKKTDYYLRKSCFKPNDLV
jgi:hypothetical protein